MTMQKAGGNHHFAWPRIVSCVLIAIAYWTVCFRAPADAANFSRGAEVAQKFGVHEIVLTGIGSVANPFDTDATVTFTPPSGTERAVAVQAFYDGGNTWRARLYVSECGTWRWRSRSADDENLNGQSGSFTVLQSNLRSSCMSASRGRSPSR